MKNATAKIFRVLSGTLMCGACRSTNVRFVEDTGPGETRYQCRRCGHYIRNQYRYKPQQDDRDVYKNFKRGLREVKQ